MKIVSCTSIKNKKFMRLNFSMTRFFFSLLVVTFFQSQTYAQKLDHVQGEFIVQLEKGVQIKDLLSEFYSYNGIKTNLRIEKTLSERLNIHQLQFDHTTINANQFQKTMYAFDGLTLIQKNHLIEQRRTPNDPDFNLQWHWMNSNDADIDAELAWDITTGGTAPNGKDIVVAIIEDGFLSSSSELSANQWINTAEIAGNGIDDDNNGYIDDVNGWNVGQENDDISASSNHGVHVASMVGGVGDNGFGGTGINWNIKMMIVKFEDFTEADMLASYSYILENRIKYNESNGDEGAFVVASNLSYGVDRGDVTQFPIWCGFYDELGDNGILNTIATANRNWDVDVEGDLPTNCSSNFIIGVTSSNNMDERAFDAAYGQINIDVAAPGQNLWMLNRNGEYALDRGTSFAAPIVAGLVGLSYSVSCDAYASLAILDPKSMATQMRDFVLQSVDPIASMANEIASGGRINAFNCVSLAMQSCPSCPDAASVVVNNTSLTSSEVSWELVDASSIVDIRYKEVTASDWNEQLGVTSPFQITGLTACTDYEVQLRTTCQDSTNGYSNSILFTSDGCCNPPGMFDAIPNRDSAEVVISWDAVDFATGYKIRYRVQGLMDQWEEAEVTDTNYTIEPILECMIYEIQVAALCFGGQSEFSTTFEWANDDCQTCTDAIYCGVTAQFNFDFIDSVIFNGNANGSGADGGYADFGGATPIGEIIPGAENTIRIVPGFTGTVLPQLYSIYIDKDHNGVFDSTDQVLLTPTGVNGSYVGTFTFPLGTALGITRMRIMMQGEDNATPFDPCTNFQIGEVEDYCVKIFFPIECTPPPIDTILVDGQNLIVWDTVPWDLVYTTRYREVGEEEWIEEATLDTFYMLPFEGCKKYEFQVRAICPSDSSAYTESFIVAAAGCITSSNAELDAGIELFKVSPNPFNGSINIDLKMKAREIFNLDVINTAGQSMYQQTIEVQSGLNSQTIDLSRFPPGMYFMVLKTDVGKVYRKIIKQ